MDDCARCWVSWSRPGHRVVWRHYQPPPPSWEWTGESTAECGPAEAALGRVFRSVNVGGSVARQRPCCVTGDEGIFVTCYHVLRGQRFVRDRGAVTGPLATGWGRVSRLEPGYRFLKSNARDPRVNPVDAAAWRQVGSGAALGRRRAAADLGS